MVALPTISVERRKQKEQGATDLIKADESFLDSVVEVRPPDELRTLRLMMTVSVFVLIVSVVLEGSIAYVSTRGSVVRYEKRRRATPYLIYARAGRRFFTLRSLAILLKTSTSITLCWRQACSLLNYCSA